MRKIDLVNIILIIVLIIFANGCQFSKFDLGKIGKTGNEMPEQKEETKTLSEFQVLACETADEAETCNTRLNELGIVLKEDCCEVLGKCC